MCRPLVSDDMRTKIHVLGGKSIEHSLSTTPLIVGIQLFYQFSMLGDYKSHLLKYIDEDQLPGCFGGTMVDPVDGGDRCASLVRY